MTQCQVEFLREESPGMYTHRCRVCGRELTRRYRDPGMYHLQCRDGTQPKPRPPGVGAIIKRKIAKLQSWLPIRLSSGGCQRCDKYAAMLDRMGPQWCSDNIGEIVDVLQGRAKEEGFPFSRTVADRIVRAAVTEAEAA